MTLETFKEQAAIKAVSFIQSGMAVGLGTGSTAKYAVIELGRRIREGELTDIVGVPTSNATADLAKSLDIPLIPLQEEGLDIAIDGADEIDPQLNLIKGLGGALVREKIVESAAEQLIIVADHTKLVPKLGRGVVPVEIVPFGYRQLFDHLKEMSVEFGQRWSWQMRMEGDQLYTTDNHNHILHLTTGAIEDAAELEYSLKSITGVVDTGIFAEMATLAIVASPEGIREIHAK